MFSYTSVCQPVCLSTWGPHVTITHDALDLTVQGSYPQKSDLGPPALPPASDIWWSSLETCSNLFIWGPPASDIWWSSLETCSNLFIFWGFSQKWHLVVAIEAHAVNTIRWYASYWNAFLYLPIFHHVKQFLVSFMFRISRQMHKLIQHNYWRVYKAWTVF